MKKFGTALMWVWGSFGSKNAHFSQFFAVNFAFLGKKVVFSSDYCFWHTHKHKVSRTIMMTTFWKNSHHKSSMDSISQPPPWWLPHNPPPDTFSWFWHVSRSFNTNQVCCRVTRPPWLRSRQYFDLKTCSARVTSTFFVKSSHFWDILSPFWDSKTPSLTPPKQYETLFSTFTQKIRKTKVMNSNHVGREVTYTARTRSRCLKVFLRRSSSATGTFFVKSIHFWDILSPSWDFKTPSLSFTSQKHYEKRFSTFT